MGLLSIFLTSLRRQVAESIRLGVTDGIKAAIGDQTAPTSEADQAETELRLLLLPAPDPIEEPAKRGRKAQ